MRGGALLINRFVGRRIRERRVLLGLNQSQLAEPLGLVVTQIVRYERGENGVSAGLLFEIARALDTSPNYFFEGLEDEAAAKVSPRQRVLLNLVRSLGEIKSREQLAVICQLTRALMTKQQRPRSGKPAAKRR
jgi:transcriptional regulator with XRE-family HTH domain